MIAWLVRNALRLRDWLYGRPPDVALLLDYHPHLTEDAARRVLTYVAGALSGDCPRTVPAVAAAIRAHFPNWFLRLRRCRPSRRRGHRL